MFFSVRTAWAWAATAEPVRTEKNMSLELANQIAAAGVAACSASGYAVAVTVVDRQNYHLFQPLLYQVATAALSPGDIAWPIRRLLRRQPNARVLLGEVTAVDAARQVLHLGERSLPYDYLVLSTGVRHDYFGHGD